MILYVQINFTSDTEKSNFNYVDNSMYPRP